MSAADLAAGGRLIQLGIAADTDIDGTVAEGSEALSLLINPGDMHWDQTAEAVHGFTREEVAQALPAAEADILVYEWMLTQGVDAKRRANTVAVGFNVGSFDLPHLAAVLPRTYSLFTRRSVDLNAIIFALEGAELNGMSAGFDAWKAAAKRYAMERIEAFAFERGGQAHDAGYDALLHLHVWRYLRAAVRGVVLPGLEIRLPVADSEVHASALISEYGLAKAAEVTGVPETFIHQWAAGGRARRQDYLDRLSAAYETLKAS
jgi:hypothetical protein